MTHSPSFPFCRQMMLSSDRQHSPPVRCEVGSPLRRWSTLSRRANEVILKPLTNGSWLGPALPSMAPVSACFRGVTVTGWVCSVTENWMLTLLLP